MLHNVQYADRQCSRLNRIKSNQILKIRSAKGSFSSDIEHKQAAAVYRCLPLAFQLTCNYSAGWWGWWECGPIRRAGSETFPLCARQWTWHVIHKQRCKQREYYLLSACFWEAVYYILNEFSTLNSHYSPVRRRFDASGVRFVAFKD